MDRGDAWSRLRSTQAKHRETDADIIEHEGEYHEAKMGGALDV